MSYKAVVIGLGQIGLKLDLQGQEEAIFSHTKAFMFHDRFELVGGVDTDEGSRMAFESFSGVKAFKSILELKKDVSQADVVSICTPSSLRLEILREVVALKPKLLIIEKPIATSLKEAELIREFAEENGIKVFINYMRRVEPFFMYLKKTLTRRNVHSATVYYTNGLFTNASHFIDLIHYFFGKENRTTLISLKKNEKDFNATFIMHYDDFHIYFNGFEGLKYSLGKIDLICKEERIIVKDWGFKVSHYEAVMDPLFPDLFALEEREPEMVPDMEKYMMYVVEHISDVLDNNAELLSDIKSATETLRVCEEIIHASDL